ncbi:MAG TPA: winged helix-turn-helix domain-containing protein [Terriglobia bacterium]|nr:winged helix-turn-helix domain-containing protein [Terriglobia bacterium]
MAGDTQRIYDFGQFRLLTGEKVLLRDGRPVPLPPKVLETLLALVENHGHLVDKETLIKRVWPDTFVEDQNLTYNISALRKILGNGSNGQKYIETVPRRGYRFIAPVTIITAGPQDPADQLRHSVDGGAQPILQHDPDERAQGVTPQGTVPGGGDSALLPQEGEVFGRPEKEQSRWARARYNSRHVMIACVAALTVVVVALCVALLARPLPVPRVVETYRLTYNERLKGQLLLVGGGKVYFQEKRGDKMALVSIRVSDGVSSTVSLPRMPTDAVVTDVSSDGSEFLGHETIPGTSKTRVCIWPATGGAPERVGEVGWSYPSLSPDGARIAYVDGGQTVCVAGRHGDTPRRLAAFTGQLGGLRWSPDGSALRLQVREHGVSYTLWEISVDSGRRHQLFPDWSNSPDVEDPGRWTSDGRYFVFSRGHDERRDIWARREGCGFLSWRCRKPMRVRVGPPSYLAPTPSPDGKKLFVLGVQHEIGLARYDAASGQFGPYLDLGIGSTELDFSHDGKWIAYSAPAPSGNAIWRSRMNGSEPQQLTFLDADAREPHWSPDGSQIAFQAHLPGDRFKAYVVSADGGTPHPLIPDQGSQEGVPTWSKDGKKIIFAERLYRRDPSEMTIHLLDLETQQLSDLPGSARPMVGPLVKRWSLHCGAQPDSTSVRRLTGVATIRLVHKELVDVGPSRAHPRADLVPRQQVYRFPHYRVLTLPYIVWGSPTGMWCGWERSISSQINGAEWRRTAHL